MTGKLSGRRALITGGSSGIDKATARLFAQEGASIAIVNRCAEKGMAFVEELNTLGGNAVFIQANVSKADDCSKAVEKAIESLGGLDILFNNAGIVQRGSILDITEEEWDCTMAINVKSIFLMCKFAVPYLAKSPYDGVIVNMGSTLSLAGGRNGVAYASSKARRPLGRIGTPEDIARGVLYLASDDGRYITGVPLIIDGGSLTAYGMG